MSVTSKSIAEFIGTFVSVLVGLFSIKWLNKNNAPFIVPCAIAVGLVAGVLICLGMNGDGHLNPAVSCAFYAKGDLNLKQLFCYSGSQIAGALLAFVVYKYSNQYSK